MFNLPKEDVAEKQKKERANRGKSAESVVQGWLKRLNEAVAAFDFERIYDARSAGGRANARTGDFNVWCAGTPFVLEVKEVNHTFRLPSKNFNENAVARMAKRQLAGAEALVLIHFTPDNTWRVVPLKVFQERETSWDLAEWPATSDTAMFVRLRDIFFMSGRV